MTRQRDPVEFIVDRAKLQSSFVVPLCFVASSAISAAKAEDTADCCGFVSTMHHHYIQLSSHIVPHTAWEHRLILQDWPACTADSVLLCPLTSGTTARLMRLHYTDDTACFTLCASTAISLPRSEHRHAGAAVLRVSANGRCCSIVWPEACRYAVYAQGSSGDWRKVDEESGSSVAWAGASSTYAVLHQPKV